MNLVSLSEAKPEIKCAELELAPDTKVMFSYGRPAAALLPDRGYVRVDQVISKTTERHIAEWVGAEASEQVSQDFLDGLLAGTARC
ncbi:MULTISPECIES: hypothetical protein [unclassified Variovorax]|uniref:hypothetical protein n=1 Tax=unclassified Variovorax TaxID=663243 RepID=UPI0008383BDC|nr:MULTISPECIES: hypothetical protein [unclassified Variovorax]PNG50375.1 hypothetical protein CHC06_05998 [Variovorax sp. B2]PNG51248.1 hypothetical protein CHC07_05904 [Variovorax sp. B4]VTU43073.1 hypothetical protein SRS16P1_00430 [Variovorax sp. SRS16]VTU43104.1 hypothetical protein E5P1_00427 [Variovorax sp. PBL-E5]VTU43471.1 hypothetical protein H6P1_00476 [Variovorax sp. PBL-H6]